MTPTVRDLPGLPPVIDVWTDHDHEVPTAAELADVRSRATAYRLASDWPTVRIGGRLKVQTVPFIRDVLGVVLLPHQETDVPVSPDP